MTANERRVPVDARQWLVAGGGGHEDGEDGIRALTVSGEGLIDFLNAYREDLLAAVPEQPADRWLACTACPDLEACSKHKKCRAYEQPIAAPSHCQYCGEPHAHDYICNEMAKANMPAVAATLEQQSVSVEPNHDQLQLIFNWIMGEEDHDPKDGWWGASSEVAKAKEFYRLLLSAARKEAK